MHKPRVKFRARTWRRSATALIATSLTLYSMAGSASAAAPQKAKRPSWTASRVRGTPEPPSPFRVAPLPRYAPFTGPTCVAQVPSRDWLVVGEIGGRIYTVPTHPQGGSDAVPRHLVLDLNARLAPEPYGEDLRLFDLTFDPAFQSNGYVYVSYVHPKEPITRLSRFVAAPEMPLRLYAESETVILTWPTGGHNGGCLRFAPDGTLYVSTGDGTGPNPPDSKKAAQDVTNLLGSVLRIDLRQRDPGKNYSIPADNPFREFPGARPEVWAYGLRNPWKMAFDPDRGDLWLCDVGWETWEMVHLIERGGNYGWSVMEGRMPQRSDVERGPTPILPPVKDHPRSEANSVTGGIVYRGHAFPELRGSFLYGDYVTGTIWSIRRASGGTFDHRELTDSDLRIIAFAEGADGEIYVLDHDHTGRLYRLEPRPPQQQVADFPRRLSETGLFASIADMTPAAGVVPYNIVARPWMDGATAVRHLALPGDTTINAAPTAEPGARSAWEFPTGTVLVKTLLLDTHEGAAKRRVETQILHYEENVWRPYTYAWNETQTDALLVDAVGRDEPLRLREPNAPSGSTERSWRFAGRSECHLCHNVPGGVLLGFEPAQLNAAAPAGGSGRPNQLDELVNQGVFSEAAAQVVSKPSIRLVDPHDSSTDLEERARSYLHVNCGVCHNSGGDSTISIYLRRSFSLAQTDTLKHPRVGTFGVREPQVLSPGDPYGSIMLYRMGKLGYARMPHIGSRVVDRRGFRLIRDWIASMEPSGRPGPWVSTSDAAALRTLRGDGDADAKLAAADHLLSSTRGSLALAYSLHGDSFDDGFRHRIVASSQSSRPTDVAGLFETFVDPAQRRTRLGHDIDPATILSRQGDTSRGQLIYFSDAARCRTCHPIAGAGESLGPDLKDVGKRYPRAELLTHILKPSAKVAPEHATYVVVTTKGDVESGLLVKKTSSEVILKTVEKKSIAIPAAEVAAMEAQPQSLMPELLLRDMTAQEAADLLAYLVSLK